VEAWSNGGYSSDPLNPKYGTHDWIAQHALDWVPDSQDFWIRSNLAIYLYGTELPDNPNAPLNDGIGDSFNHHIYYRITGELQDDVSARRAQECYDQSVSFLLQRDFYNAAKWMGIATHYIADVAVFGHVMGSGTDWGSEIHHSDYETWINGLTQTYSSSFTTYLRFDGRLDSISARDASLALARDTTFDLSLKGHTCKWMDLNYDISNTAFQGRAGESINLAVNLIAEVIASAYTRTLFDFSMSAQQTSVAVPQGSSGSNAITVTYVAGTPQTVTLSTSGLPSGVSASFNPSSGSPTFTSSLTLTVSSTANPSRYNTTVTGVGGNATHTVTFSLTIQPRIVRPPSYLASNPLGRVFFVFNNKKYYITNMDAFNSYGLNSADIKNYTQMNPDSYANSQINYDYLLDGKMPLPNRPYIAGDVNDGSLYYVPYYTWSGSKYPINWTGYNAYGGQLKALLIRYGDPAISLPTSSTVLNGTNPIPVATSPSYVIGKNPLNRVFFIFNGYKYYFTDWPIYLSYGFTNANINATVNPDTYPNAQVRFDYLLEDLTSVFRKPLPNQPYIVGDVNDGSLYWVAYFTYTGEKYPISWPGYNGYGGQLKAMHTRYGDPSILLTTSAYVLDGVNPIPQLI
jgi:hypothetical protein